MIKAHQTNTEPIPHPVKSILKDSGISQLKAAFKIGISQGYLSQMLNGYREIPQSIKTALYEILCDDQGRDELTKAEK